MIATWIVGLLVVFVATPVAVASFISALRSGSPDSPDAAQPVPLHFTRHAPHPHACPDHQRHYRRRIAA